MERYTHRHALEAFKHVSLDRSGFTVDEMPWSNLYIIRKLQEIRASEMRKGLITNSGISEFCVQTLPCLEVEDMDRNECPCAPASGCYWLKSKEPLPRFIRLVSVTGIVPNEESPRFTFIKWDRFQYIPKSRNISVRKGNYWTIRDTGSDGAYLYLYGNRNLELITVSGIWEDPMYVEAYPSCGEVDINAKCNPLDVDFYTDAEMRDVIIDIAWQKLLPVRAAAGSDTRNNDVSDIGAQTNQT